MATFWTFVTASMFSYVLLGAIALFVMDRNKGREPLSVFQAININSAKPIARLFDLIISCILGGLIVFLLTKPGTIEQAIAAGLGTTGLLSSFGKSTS
jgi:hypothetical protein